MYDVKVEFQKDFIKVEGNRIIVGLTSKPKKGKANAELIKKLLHTSIFPHTRLRSFQDSNLDER
jgi:uncharacterized protein YggU (UPF0235/DUF167 family)